MFLPHFDVFCDLLNFIRIKADGDVNRASDFLQIIGKNQSKCENNLGYINIY